MIAKLMKFLKKNYLYILGSLLIAFMIMMVVRENFTIIDLIVPPLQKLSTDEYAYGCPINGYKCSPTMIYMVKLQGKAPQDYMRYVKYKMIDQYNVTRYSGLYKNLEGLSVGSYVTFDNGQDFVITSLDTMNDQPEDCPAIRKDPADMDRGALRMMK